MPLLPSSEERLKTCHEDLQRLIWRVAELVDVLVICGHRDETAQKLAFDSGKSKLNWPNSRHNSFPSEAVDLAPLPLDWSHVQRFVYLSELVKRCATELGIEIEWGGDWKFKDLDHFQLKRKESV